MRIHYLRSIIAGCVALTASGAFAQQQLPYSCALNTQALFDTWSVYDVDQNTDDEHATWFLGESDNGGKAACSWAFTSNYSEVSNWLVSPALKFDIADEGDITLKFDYYTTYSSTEHVNIYLSKSPDPSAEHTLLKEAQYKGCYYSAGKETIELPAITEAGNYYISFQHVSDGHQGQMIFIKNVKVTPIDEGTLKGTAKSGSTPVGGLTVTATGPQTYTATTADDGSFSFGKIAAGNYSVTWEKFGYESPATPVKANVTAGSTVDLTLEVAAMERRTVKGRVTDNKGNALPDALVTLKGYAGFSATTDASGNYSISGVYLNKGAKADAPYTMTITKNNFTDYIAAVNVKASGATTDFGTTKLTYNALAPFSVTSTDGKINWEAPVDARLKIYDNGHAAEDPIGYDAANNVAVIGVVCRDKYRLYGVDFYRKTTDYSADPPELVNIWIIGLDADGEPNGEIIYRKDNVKSLLNGWTSVKFDEPVVSDNGFVVALNTNGYLSLGRDDNPEPVEPRTQVFSNSYVAGYRYFDDLGWPGALMLRPLLERKEDAAFTPDRKYNVYRIKNGDTAGRTSVASGITALTATDSQWNSLGRGSYSYAVETVYPVDNLTSEPIVSAEQHIAQFASVTVSLTADSDNADVADATVTLKSAENSYTAKAVDGKATFADVWKDEYTLSAIREGFEAAPAEISANDDNRDEYAFTVAMKQKLLPPVNIDAQCSHLGVKVSWDIFRDFSDSFEGNDYADFEINAPGALGWSYIDGDGLTTYGFGGLTFPGMKSPMAAIVMNGQETEPTPTSIITAHRGDRSMAFFAAAPIFHDGGTQLNWSDDYMISPRLSFHKDFTVSLWAMSYESVEGRLEQIRLGYTKGEADDLDSYTWDELQEVPERTWTQYTWTIPAEARYVALNSKSNDVFMLLVDEFAMGTGITDSGLERSSGKFNGYSLSIDGGEPVLTKENSMLVTTLPNGVHTASVKKLYNGGESPAIEVTFDKQTGIASVGADSNVSISLDGRTLLISGDFANAEVYDTAGKRVVSGINAPATDLSHLAAGVYIVRAGMATSKIVLR